ncbi:MAG: tyrosine-type recombinase/integrase [Terriglobales bacterium]
MSLIKRGGIWWADFALNGLRYRQSLKTADWRKAEGREKELIAEAAGGKLASTTVPFARLPFSAAGAQYLAEKALRTAASSVARERSALRPLAVHFGSASPGRITCESALDYITRRKAAGVSNRTVNLELGVLRGTLKRAKRWHLFADELKPLPISRGIGRALAPEEKERLLRLARLRSDWQFARLATVMALNTTSRRCELLGLRWRDVDLSECTFTIRRASTKTDAGERMIPLNGDAMAAVLELRASASVLGVPQPDHFLFPWCAGRRPPDPTRPMKGWRSAWRSLTSAINCPVCGLLQAPARECRRQGCGADVGGTRSPLAGLRFHDLRHHAITELSESQASDQIIMAIAGHVSPKMLAHYSHVRMAAKRKALAALSGVAQGGSRPMPEPVTAQSTAQSAILRHGQNPKLLKRLG